MAAIVVGRCMEEEDAEKKTCKKEKEQHKGKGSTSTLNLQW